MILNMGIKESYTHDKTLGSNDYVTVLCRGPFSTKIRKKTVSGLAIIIDFARESIEELYRDIMYVAGCYRVKEIVWLYPPHLRDLGVLTNKGLKSLATCIMVVDGDLG